MRNNSVNFNMIGFSEMDAARKQLIGAGKLKLFIRMNNRNVRYTGSLSEVQQEYDTICIDQIESEQVKIPLIHEHLIGNLGSFRSQRNFH